MADLPTASRGPERRQLTVMFCDIVESTRLSLRLDPEELAEVIQAYRRHCAGIIKRHDGVVARLLGDGILAYFGYPRAHENDAERAIRAALEISGTAWSAVATADLKVHIGIATGIVVVGDLPDGGEPLAAIGNAPNLAARLEALAGPGEIVVSEQTRRLTGGLFDYHDLGPRALKGFDEPIPAWRVLDERKVGSRFHALRASARTPLVNRVAELEELRELWDATKRGQGQALLIVSEPGVGKSRLTEVLAERIVDPPCLSVWYHCSPNLQSSPLAPVIRQFAIAAGFAEHDDDATRLRKLEALIPKLAMDAPGIVALLANLLSVRIAGEYVPVDMSPQRQKRRLFQVLMQSLEAFAAAGPFLLVIEDLHWIDPTSDELIGVLIDRLNDLPILVVLTARPEFQSHWEDKPRLRQMALRPLDRNDTVTMIEAICGDEKLPAAAVAQIAERTDGLPLFIEDLTYDVLEGSSGAIPTTLNDSLMSRLDRLGSARSVAETAAAIGREFSYELLVKVADLPEEHVRDEIRRLVDAGLLVSGRSTAVLGYAFKHALVRDAAYSNLLKKKQVALHGRIAQVLIGDFPELAENQPEVVAYHLQAAGELDHAVDYLVRAAKLSARRSGFTEAIAHLDRGLALLGKQPASPARLRRELSAYRALGGIYAEHRGFSSEECGRAFTRALEICRELGDTPEIFAVLSGVGSFEITRAGFAKCRELAAECLERAAAQTAKPPFIMGHLLLGGTQFLQGELAQARSHLEEALHLYDDDQAPRRGKQVLYVQDQKSTGLCYLALTLTIMGEADQGVRAAETGLAHSRSLGGLHTINYSMCYLASVLYIRGDMPAALRCATESLESAREQGFATWIGISQVVRGAALARTGQVDEGLAELGRGMGAHSGMQANAYQPFVLTLWAEGLLAAGRHGEALDALDRAIAVSEARGERFYTAEVWSKFVPPRHFCHSILPVPSSFTTHISELPEP
jgi:class 3 adenylate cyclase/tetratricopeptide (TPR) repeat protein